MHGDQQSPKPEAVSHLPQVRFRVSLIAALALGTSSAFAQTWSTGFFNTNQGWVRATNVTGQNSSDPVGSQWQGNDPETQISPTLYVGGTDLVAFASGYTPFGSLSGNSSLIQGGAFLSTDYFPGTNSVRLWRSFNPVPIGPAGTVSFQTEWAIIGTTDVSYTNLDSFAFDLRNLANSDSLLRLQFTPSINILSNAYTLQTMAAGAPTNTVIDLGYGSLFQMQVDLTGTNYSLSLSRLDPTSRAVLTNYTDLAVGILASGLTAEDFGTVGLDWDLTSGDAVDPGSNYIIVNEVTVVPEPSTYALLGIAAVTLVVVLVRRRRA